MVILIMNTKKEKALEDYLKGLKIITNKQQPMIVLIIKKVI